MSLQYQEGLAFAPNRALREHAGPFAEAIARVWPRPHAAYLEAEPARQRLIQLMAARAPAPVLAARARELAEWSVRRALDLLLPDAPAGLAGALKKLEGREWTTSAFGALLALLADAGAGAKTLHHAPVITPALVALLIALPVPLRRGRIAELLGEAPQLAGAITKLVANATQGDRARQRVLAERLERAGSFAAMAAMLLEVGHGSQARPSAVSGAVWLRPITCRHEMGRVGLKFRNCLKDRTPMLQSGAAQYFEVLGEEPAVVEVVLDARVCVWRFGEMRGHANADLSPDLVGKIRGFLALQGVEGWAASPRNDPVRLLAQAMNRF